MSQIKNTRYFRVVSDAALTLLVVSLAVTGIMLPGLQAQPNVSAIADLPLADPIIDSDAQFHAQRTSIRYDGVIQYMFLKRDVSVAVGTYGFRADNAVIRIQRQATTNGQEVRHMWMYLDNAQPLPGRGPTSATAPRLLVTVSTTGKVDLSTDMLEKVDHSGQDLTADAWIAAVYILAATATAIRIIAAFAPETQPESLWLGIVLWMAAFAIFTVRYGRLILAR